MGLQAIVKSGVGSSGAGPSAPNIASATAAVNYSLVGNTYFWNVDGAVTLPALPDAIASIVITVNGPQGSGGATLLRPSGGWGATASYQTQASAMPLASYGISVVFTVVNANGAVTASPYIIFSLSVNPTTISSLTIAEVGPRIAVTSTTSIQVTPTLSNTHGLQYVTFWYSWDGGTTLYWYDVFPFFPGATTSIDIEFIIRTITQSGGLTSNNFVVYALVGAQPGSSATSTSYAALLSQFPLIITSNAITVLPSAPASSSTTATLVNNLGATATQSNIYMGLNSLQNPYFIVRVNLQTAGANDPNTYAYTVGCIWTDASGTPISPGGVSNPYGWQDISGDETNDGSLHAITLVGNYPAPGVDAYLQFQVWAANLNTADGSVGSGLQVPPFTGNSQVTLQACWPGSATFDRLHVGPPPATLTGTNLTNQPSTANPTGAPSTASQNVGTSILPDWQFNFAPLGVMVAPSQWGFGGPGGITIKNDGVSSTAGILNYAAIVGPSTFLNQTVPLPMGGAFYFAMSARNNNASLAVVANVGFLPSSGSGYTNGTYFGIPLNGAGGTGATLTVSIVGNAVFSFQISAIGGGYTPNTSFTLPLTAGGGTGITIFVFTGAAQLQLLVTAYNSNMGIVNVDGNVVNVFAVNGSVASWEITATSGILQMPANVARISIQIESSSATPPTFEWDVTNVIVEPVVNQSVGGQTNTQVPQSQTAAMSAIATFSETTTQSATYGLAYLEMVGTAGENINLSTGSGQAAIDVDGPTGSSYVVAISSSSLGAIIQITGPGANNIIEFECGSSGPTLRMGANSGYTGSVSGRSCVNGIVI